MIQPLCRCFDNGELKLSFDAGYVLWQTARALVELYENRHRIHGVIDLNRGINSLVIERITVFEAGHCTVDIGT